MAERRRELGLSREEVAQRAGMDPTYVAYLEGQPSARPEHSTLFRLAVALETTVPKLQGAGTGWPPGASVLPAGTPVFEVMTDQECMGHIRLGGIGRLVFDDERGPVALPVNFRMLGDDLVFRTGEGSIAAGIRAGKKVSLEVDHLDDALGEGWSVLITGKAYEVTDPKEIGQVNEVGIEPWAGGDRHVVVRLVPTQITGREIRRRLQA